MPYKRKTTKRRVVRRKRRTGQKGKGIFGDIYKGIKKGVKYLRKTKILSRGANAYGKFGFLPYSSLAKGAAPILTKAGFGLRSGGGRRIAAYRGRGKGKPKKRGRKKGSGLRRGGGGLVRSGGVRTRKTRVMGRKPQCGRGRIRTRRVFP